MSSDVGVAVKVPPSENLPGMESAVWVNIRRGRTKYCNMFNSSLEIDQHVRSSAWKHSWLRQVGIDVPTASATTNSAGRDPTPILNTEQARRVAVEDCRRDVVLEKARENKFRNATAENH